MKPRLLATGFYFRDNLGDSCYPLVLRRIFGDTVDCQCTDDLTAIPEGTDAIIVGGGDVVCPFFMEKIADLVKDFYGPLYLLSVGIPYAKGPDLRYLLMFDHVFVRTAADYAVANTVLPAADLTWYRDMAWSIPRTVLQAGRVSTGIVALTLAQPYFSHNPHAKQMKAAIVEIAKGLAQTNSQVLLLAFNTHLEEASECDILLNREICQQVQLPNVVSVEDVKEPKDMLELFETLDLLVAMRLHSVIFACMQHLPFVSLYTTQKMSNMLQDVGADAFSIKLPLDEFCRPTSIDAQAVLDLARLRLEAETTYQWREPDASAIDWEHVKKLLTDKKRRSVNHGPIMRSFDVAGGRCRSMVKAYTGMSDAAFDGLLAGRVRIQEIINPDTVSYLELCRIICFALSGSTCSPCLWGLHTNCQQSNFNLEEAMRFIHGHHMQKSLAAMIRLPMKKEQSQAKPSHYVEVTSQDLHEFSDTHRSGWPYVVNGLMAFDSRSHSKKPELLVDTYVDRTFHWGHDALFQEHTIPYTKPWVGFVHHTFTLQHGPYNCVRLFECPSFLASLPACQCLIALSNYLAHALRLALKQAGYPAVGVEVLLHPTEPVPEQMYFAIDKLRANPNPKLVQIGTWLRSSYALYKMPYLTGGDLQLQRCVLKCKESANYLKHPCVEDAMQLMLEQSRSLHDKKYRSYNFYVQELIEHLREQEQSVQLLERLSNDEYDALLSCNVAFLRLVDCSACNTIIECIMRSGVVICNRHPAVVEYLGADYPGFYDNLAEAAAICSSYHKIEACHKHMAALDRRPLMLETFLAGFDSILQKYLG